MPCASAVASTNGLKDEPGCRSPWTARLNWLFEKLVPPIMARMSPVARIDRDERRLRPVRLGSHLSIASRASRLDLEVDRRVDLEPASEDLAGAVVRDQLALHVLGEVLRRAASTR